MLRGSSALPCEPSSNLCEMGAGSGISAKNRRSCRRFRAGGLTIRGFFGRLAGAFFGPGRRKQAGQLFPDAFRQRALAELGCPLLSQPLAAFEELVMGELGQPSRPILVKAAGSESPKAPSARVAIFLVMTDLAHDAPYLLFSETER